MVLGCPKYISGKFRSFSKKSPQNFSFFHFFSKSRGILSKVLAAKNAFGGGLKRPKMAIEPKKAIFSKSKIMIPQSNLGKRKVKLMLVRP